MDTERPVLGDLVRHGAETPLEVKDEAFRLWIENGRSWRRVSTITGIGESTLHNWANKDQWELRRADQAAAFMPGRRAETAISLQMAAYNASLRLQQIAWEAAELGVKPDIKEVTALTSIVDRAGHAPSKPDPIDSRATRPSLPPLTTEERTRLAARIAGTSDT